MKLIETGIEGTFLIELERVFDERGFFVRSWCASAFERLGLDPSLVQCNISFNTHAGTLRGMHYQAAPHEETKLVRVTSGAIFDVVADVRPNSASFGQWKGFRLDAENRHLLYIPKGVAHGFQTLEPASEVFYQMGTYYVSEAARGFRYDDPTFAIQWPLDVSIISDRDRAFPYVQS